MLTLSPTLVSGATVIVRTDMNVPLSQGHITEDTRIRACVPTLRYLLDHGAQRIHVLTHLGRPKGTTTPDLSTEVLVQPLSDLLGESVEFRPDFTGSTSRIQLHQNLRFDPREKANDPTIIDELMGLSPTLFVNDAFAVSHRAHASVVGFADRLPCAAGHLLQAEINAMSPYLASQRIEGLTLIVGGAKIDTKIPLLKQFAATADHVLVGGALANTFLSAQGYDVGQSLYQPEQIDTARDIMCQFDTVHTGLHMPIDVICADDVQSTQTADVPIEDVCGDMRIFDLGPHTIHSYKEIIAHASAIIWNGPVGLSEFPPFATGTRELLQALANSPATTIIGGGDTLQAIADFGFTQSQFSHVSTGGGAMLAFLGGEALPGITALSAE